MRSEQKNRAAKRRQFILRLIIILLLSLFLGYTVYMINAKRVMKDLLPMPFGVGSAVVLSGSMEPTLSVNDFVLVRAADSYRVNDVVVFQSDGELVIHRVVSAEGDSLVTRGDANNTDDPPISIESVKGKMLFAVPFVGLLIRWLQTLPGVILVLALAILLMRLSWRKERNVSNQEQESIKAEIRRLQEQLSRQEPAEKAEQEPPEPTTDE